MQAAGFNIDHVVHPVLVFPGWWVEPLSDSDKLEFWALAKRLFGAIDGAPDRFSPEQVAMATKHLSAGGVDSARPDVRWHY